MSIGSSFSPVRNSVTAGCLFRFDMLFLTQRTPTVNRRISHKDARSLIELLQFTSYRYLGLLLRKEHRGFTSLHALVAVMWQDRSWVHWKRSAAVLAVWPIDYSGEWQTRARVGRCLATCCAPGAIIVLLFITLRTLGPCHHGIAAFLFANAEKSSRFGGYLRIH